MVEGGERLSGGFFIVVSCDNHSRIVDPYHRAASVDDDLFKIHETPGSASKTRKGSVFGSLEKMFNMLTPKKQKSTSEGPRKVKVSFRRKVKKKNIWVAPFECAHTILV